MVGVRDELAALMVGALLVAGCSGRDAGNEKPGFAGYDPAAFSGEAAYEELVALLERGPRDSGTVGAADAARYLRERLEAQGVDAEIDAFEDRSPKGDMVFRNVIGRLPGRGEGLIIIGSHYDTKAGMEEGFQGANDSGSSTAALIELARVLAEGPEAGPEMWLVCFDGEECMVRYGPNDGLHGSRHMAKQLVASGRAEDVAAVIVLDMIGDRDLTVTIPRNSDPDLVSVFFDAAKAEGVRTSFSLYPFQIGDDHVPFMEAGMPAIDLIDFYFGSEPGRNDYWHTPEDTIDKISGDSLETIGRVVLRGLNTLVRRQARTDSSGS